MRIENFEPIFGEPKIEWAGQVSQELHRFLFYVLSPDSSHLRILVTDFHCNTWEAKKSVSQLEDVMDIVGIGGSFLEFIDYMTSSLKSEDVKLILKSPSDKDEVTQAKLVAQKSKGMPIISINLTKLVDSAAHEAMSTISLGLYDAFKKEQERCLQLPKGISYEKEKSDTVESHLEQYSKTKKLQKINGSDKRDASASLLSSGLQNSPNKLAAKDTGSTKGTKRVVPAYRRTKGRGVLLQDTEDDNNAVD